MSDVTLHTARPRKAASRSVLGTFIAVLALWRSRRQLASLDESRLKDLGIGENEAQKEANRPIWDVPAHWLR